MDWGCLSIYRTEVMKVRMKDKMWPVMGADPNDTDYMKDMITEEEDLIQREKCKNQILDILNKNRSDSVYDAVAELFTHGHNERARMIYCVEPLRKVLNIIAKTSNSDVVRMAAWQFFDKDLDYDDYVKGQVKEKE
jgi:hypothetical protein